MLSDLDGTLIDSTEPVHRIWDAYARRHGLDTAHVIDYIYGRPTREAIPVLVPDADTDSRDRRHRRGRGSRRGRRPSIAGRTRATGRTAARRDRNLVHRTRRGSASMLVAAWFWRMRRRASQPAARREHGSSRCTRREPTRRSGRGRDRRHRGIDTHRLTARRSRATRSTSMPRPGPVGMLSRPSFIVSGSCTTASRNG